VVQFLLFGTIPNALAVLGMGIIIAAGVWAAVSLPKLVGRNATPDLEFSLIIKVQRRKGSSPTKTLVIDGNKLIRQIQLGRYKAVSTEVV
jgi:hypothetical protein